jgi:hypothetical protein
VGLDPWRGPYHGLDGAPAGGSDTAPSQGNQPWPNFPLKPACRHI